MKLHDDWRLILRKAWSIRFMAIAAILSGIEAVLPFFSDAFPRGLFAILTIIFVSAGFVSRLVAQQKMGDKNAD